MKIVRRMDPRDRYLLYALLLTLLALERVMDLGENPIEMRVPGSTC
jgi:hypothetical protein